MQQRSSHSPKLLRLDKGFKQIAENESVYLLNHTPLLNLHGGKANSLGMGTPLPANFPACEMDQPAGENYAIGSHRSPLTNELYSWVYNNNEVHYIQRINGYRICEVVYSGPCVSLSADPKHAIEDWRAYLHVEKVCPNRDGKYLVWTDGTDTPIGYLDTEASIATNNFTTPFFDRCADPCAYVQMCVPEPCGCIQAEFVPLPDDEVGLNNNLVDTPVQIMFQHVYYDGRESIWSDRSKVYYQNSRGCFENASGFSRCLKIRIPVGNPLVDKIRIAFSTDGKNWFITETVEKYKKYNDSQQKWYERELAELLNYSDVDCSFDYIFCNNKDKIAVDPTAVSRVRNPIPREVQGLFPISTKTINGDALAFYNYKDGVCPVDELQIEKFTIDPVFGEESVNCTQETVTVTVRAIIHDYVDDRNQPIYRVGGGAIFAPDDLSDRAYFGGYKEGFLLPPEPDKTYGQNFNGVVRNFIPYVEGTDFWAEMKQWKSDAFFTNQSEVGVLGDADTSLRTYWKLLVDNGSFFYQEAKIKVIKGTKGFIRLPSHESINGSGNNQNTSTYVVGTYPSLTNYKGDYDLQSSTDFTKHEIYFDTCNGDVVLEEVFVIQDMTNESTYYGYIKDEYGLPVEGADLRKSGTGAYFGNTDHNGFYHFYTDDGSFGLDIKVELDCISFSTVQTMSLVGSDGSSTEHNETITSDTYKDNFYLSPKVKVINCDGEGVGGVVVAISGSKYRVTDGSGIATFRLRNYITRDRSIVVVVMNNNGCLVVDCEGNCNPCMPSESATTPACYIGTQVQILPDLRINIQGSESIRGLKSGGRYGYSVVVQGDCGRLSAAYPVGGGYLDILKTQQKGNISFPSFSYNGNGIVLPTWGKCLKILRTINLNPYQLQWVVDKIERTPEGKIKLTIQSLNDYNTRYNNQTNTVYQWLKGDRIEFIKNGDGQIFLTSQNGLLNYLTISPFNDEIISGETDAPANFFNQLLIEDDGRLAGLIEGAIIEMQRPNSNTSANIFYEICVTIPILSDGTLQYDTGTFTTFDTYLVNRTINGSFLGQFEHFSPSDFWGDSILRVSDIGKAHVANEFETERRYGRNITIASPTIRNYFGDFIKTIPAAEHGDIIAIAVYDAKIGIAIGENDNFLFRIGDDFLRLGSDNIVQAAPVDSIISDPEPKVSGRYGLKYNDIGSLFFGDGFCTWIDGMGVFVKHDFSFAKDAGSGKVASYFMKKAQTMKSHNRINTDPLNKLRYSTGLNYATGILAITIKTLRQSGINNETNPYSKQNCTILYNPKMDDFFGFASYTPEHYNYVNLDDENGCALIVFMNGLPYIHPTVSDRFNEFFGIACDEMMTVTGNKFSEKQKGWLSIENQSNMMWFAKEITNGNANFVSEIPPIRFTRSNDKWNAAFLFNKNSKGGLYGNGGGVPDATVGFFVNVLLIRDNTNGNVYNSINDQKRVQYNETDNVYLKFQMIEESGLTENL